MYRIVGFIGEQDAVIRWHREGFVPLADGLAKGRKLIPEAGGVSPLHAFPEVVPDIRGKGLERVTLVCRRGAVGEQVLVLCVGDEEEAEEDT